MNGRVFLFNDVQDKRLDFLASYHDFWTEHAFLTWQWWFLLITTILVWILWMKKVDKKRIHLILNYGLIIGIISLIFDMIGTNHGAWAYPIRLYWSFIPPLLPFDLTYIPVVNMLIYQRYGKKWTNYLTANFITSAIISFVIEPFFQGIGIYVTYHWKHIYSFPIYILLACFVKVVVEFINKKQTQE